MIIATLPLLLIFICSLAYPFLEGVNLLTVEYILLGILSYEALRFSYIFSLVIIHSDEFQVDMEDTSWSQSLLETLLYAVGYATIGWSSDYRVMLGIGIFHVGFMTLLSLFGFMKEVGDDNNEQ